MHPSPLVEGMRALPLLLPLLALAPLAGADHGLHLAAAGALDGGGTLAYEADYLFGIGDAQTWAFTVLVDDEALLCDAFGSIEVGFVGIGCDLATGGTRDPRPFGNVAPDVHRVPVSALGRSGSATQSSTPDLV